jgi:hypothetical protein
MRSKDEAGAPQEHRYYKRVIRRATTICGGLAVAVSLFLPVGPSAATSPIQAVPLSPPAPTAASSPSTPYERVWMTPVTSTAPMELALTPTVVLLAGADTPLEARSLENGSVVWTSSAAIGMPVVSEGRVFGIGDGRLQAISLDRGEPLWSVPLDGASTGPTLAADLVVVAAGDYFHAYRTGDGAPLWRQSLGAPALGRPIDAGGLVIVTLHNNQVAAFDRQTGNPAWRAALDSPPSPAAAGHERLFFGTAAGICALHVRSGDLAWCFRTAPVPAAGAPLVDGPLVYFALRDNTLRAFEPGGTLKRLESLPARPTAGPFRAGTHVAVPMATGTFALLALAGPQAPPKAAFDPLAGHTLQAAAGSADGGSLVSLTDEIGGGRFLIGYRQKVVAPPAKTP